MGTELGGLAMAPGPALACPPPAGAQTRVVTISIIANPTIQIYELAATPTVMCDVMVMATTGMLQTQSSQNIINYSTISNSETCNLQPGDMKN